MRWASSGSSTAGIPTVAIGRVQLKHLDDWNHQRRATAAVYEELFAKRDLPLEVPPEPSWGYHTREALLAAGAPVIDDFAALAPTLDKLWTL